MKPKALLRGKIRQDILRGRVPPPPTPLDDMPPAPILDELQTGKFFPAIQLLHLLVRPVPVGLLPTRHDLVERRAQGEDVGPHAAGRDLVAGQVVRGVLDDEGLGAVERRAGEVAQPEVHPVVEEELPRREVRVHDAVAVDVIDGLDGLARGAGHEPVGHGLLTLMLMLMIMMLAMSLQVRLQVAVVLVLQVDVVVGEREMAGDVLVFAQAAIDARLGLDGAGAVGVGAVRGQFAHDVIAQPVQGRQVAGGDDVLLRRLLEVTAKKVLSCLSVAKI